MTAMDDLPLVDHHCHGLIRVDPDRALFESLLTEADTVSPLGTTLFDSLIGLAVRRWCAPILDLPAHAPAADYLARRAELGATEVNRRFLTATGVTDLLVDGGFEPDLLTTAGELATLTGARAHDIVRLETLAENIARSGIDAAGFGAACASALAERARTAVGAKSVAAYRVGLRLAGARPTDAEVRAAAGRWLMDAARTGTVRLADETLHRFLIWQAIDARLPVQFHIGLGDADLHLADADPLHLTDLLRATRSAGVPILLLHNYPFHRNAAYLAQVFPHVFMDTGLTMHNTGFRSRAVLAEALELVPFGKFLFSSDAAGLAELHYLGAHLFRLALADFLADAAVPAADAAHIAALICHANARRVYRLPN